jgi:ankyrin repeat protein
MSEKIINFTPCGNNIEKKLINAIKSLNQKKINRYLSCNINFNYKDEDGKTPLIWACLQNSYKTVEKLLKKNASLEISDEDGKTPLIWASELGYKNIIELLLKDTNIIIDRRDKYSMSALAWASLNGNTEIMNLLIEKGADIDLIDRDGNTPLMHAVWSGNLEAVKY